MGVGLSLLPYCDFFNFNVYFGIRGSMSNNVGDNLNQ